ncbi:MAG TPA: hypothetical protein VFS52_04575 [Steroidobacteraceae bacterium]|nr:hypothetical protein [Steroidobacteraceae bacterium]
MNESAFALFMQGFKRGLWLAVAFPVGVVAAVVRTAVTLCYDEGPFAPPTKKSQH